MESTRTLATDRGMGEKTLSDEEANVPSEVTEEPSLEYDVNKVYSVWSPQQKRLALLAGGLLSFIVPFTDTIYLPALPSIQIDLQTTNEKVAATVSVYMGAIGLGQLIWGVLSDRYGTLLAFKGFFYLLI